MRLEFTPLEFETSIESIYQKMAKLEFTPLEFETSSAGDTPTNKVRLEFTPLEFETIRKSRLIINGKY